MGKADLETVDRCGCGIRDRTGVHGVVLAAICMALTVTRIAMYLMRPEAERTRGT